MEKNIKELLDMMAKELEAISLERDVMLSDYYRVLVIPFKGKEPWHVYEDQVIIPKKVNINDVLYAEKKYNRDLLEKCVAESPEKAREIIYGDVTYEIWNKEKKRTWSLNAYFLSIGEAYQVLGAMIDKAENSSDHSVSVYDFLSFCGLPDEHEEVTKQIKWSFSDVSTGCTIRKNEMGYYIDFPKTVTLDAFGD